MSLFTHSITRDPLEIPTFRCCRSFRNVPISKTDKKTNDQSHFFHRHRLLYSCHKIYLQRYLSLIVYAHGRRLCSNWFRHGSTIISYPQCSLTFLRERYLHRFREQSFAIRAYAMSAVGIDVVSVHRLFAYRVVSTVSTDIVSSNAKYCRIAYGITR